MTSKILSYPFYSYYVPEHRTYHIRKLLSTEWRLQADFKDAVLVQHLLLYWSGTHLATLLQDGCLYKDGRLYSVKYHNCTKAEATTSQQVALSFRVAHHKYNVNPIVLVSCAKSSIHHKSKAESKYGRIKP